MDDRIDSAPNVAAQPNRLVAEVWLLLACYACLYVLVGMVVNGYVLTTDVVGRTWVETGLESQFEEFAARRKSWLLYGYLLTPFFVLIKVGFTAICLAIGCALLYWDVRFFELFRAAALAEMVWAAATILHLAAVWFIVDVETLADFTTFYPLSALQLVDLAEEDLWAAYLLKTMNLFEVAYVGVLSVTLRTGIRKSFPRLAAMVVASYGGGMLLLVSAVTFLMMAIT